MGKTIRLLGIGVALGTLLLLGACSTAPAPPPVVQHGVDARRLYAQGMGAYKAQDYRAAIPFFQQALRLQPSLDEAAAALAWSYYHLGAYRESTFFFRQALNGEPGWKDLYDGLGWSRYQLGRYDIAIQAFRQALRLDSEYRDARIGLAYSEFQVGDYAHARPILETLVREGEGNGENAAAAGEEEVRSRLAWTLLYLKDYDRAEKEFRRGIQVRPDASELYDGLGWTYLAKDRPQLALESFQEALRLKPDYRDAQNGMRLASQAPNAGS